MFQLKNLRFLSVFLLCIGILWVCTGGKLAARGTAQAGYRLTYKANVGDVFHYEKTREGSRTSERGGQSFESFSDSKFAFHLQTEKVDSLITFVLTVDTLWSTFESMRGANSIDFGDIKGKRIHAPITQRGETREMVPIDSIPEPQMGGRPMRRRFGMQEMGGGRLGWLRVGFFEIPNRQTKIGDSWTETKRDTLGRENEERESSRTTITKSKIKYEVLGQETKMGLTCLHIKMKTEYTREMSGTMGGSEMSSEGEGETESDVWFAYKEGMLVEFTQTDFYEGTMAFSGMMSGTMPTSSETKTALKLVKWKPGKP